MTPRAPIPLSHVWGCQRFALPRGPGQDKPPPRLGRGRAAPGNAAQPVPTLANHGSRTAGTDPARPPHRAPITKRDGGMNPHTELGELAFQRSWGRWGMTEPGTLPSARRPQLVRRAAQRAVRARNAQVAVRVRTCSTNLPPAGAAPESRSTARPFLGDCKPPSGRAAVNSHPTSRTSRSVGRTLYQT